MDETSISGNGRNQIIFAENVEKMRLGHYFTIL